MYSMGSGQTGGTGSETDPTEGGKYWICSSCGARTLWRYPACLMCESPAPLHIAARAAATPPTRGMRLANSKAFEYAVLIVVVVLVIGGITVIRGERFGFDAVTVALITAT